MYLLCEHALYVCTIYVHVICRYICMTVFMLYIYVLYVWNVCMYLMYVLRMCLLCMYAHMYEGFLSYIRATIILQGMFHAI